MDTLEMLSPTTVELVVVAALVVADEMAGEERAARDGAGWFRSSEAKEAARIVREHGIPVETIPAYQSLARSRGVSLAVVLRARLSGDLGDIVRLPAIRQGT